MLWRKRSLQEKKSPLQYGGRGIKGRGTRGKKRVDEKNVVGYFVVCFPPAAGDIFERKPGLSPPPPPLRQFGALTTAPR